MSPVFDTGPAQYVIGSAPVVNATAPAGAGTANTASRIVIDGTPMRVVILAMAGAAGVVILRWSGFKFNVAI
jgi:hypothetical protein